MTKGHILKFILPDIIKTTKRNEMLIPKMNCTRLGARQSGITGVATAHHFVVLTSHTGGKPHSRTTNKKLPQNSNTIYKSGEFGQDFDPL